MYTIVDTLSSSDLFLVETSTGTKYLCAFDINYLSEQFLKKFDTVYCGTHITAKTDIAVLSTKKINLLNTTNTANITGGAFNSVIINKGLITSAYNVYDSATQNLSSTAYNQMTAVSALFPNVFFETGSAQLLSYKRGPYGGSIEQLIVGTKTVPSGLTIGAEDIQIKVGFTPALGDLIYNSLTTDISGRTINHINSAYPVFFLKDFDYSLEFYQDGELYDYGNNYVQNNKVTFYINILNNPGNFSNPLFVYWKALKFY